MMKAHTRFIFKDFFCAEDEQSDHANEDVLQTATPNDNDNLITGADSIVRSISQQDLVDAEKRGYAIGREEAAAEYEKKIEQLQAKFILHDRLSEALNKITTDNESLAQKILSIESIIAHLVQSFALKIPSDFGTILHKKVFPLINKIFLDEEITIKLHSDNIARCKEEMLIAKLPEKLQNKVILVENNELDKYECVVTCGETNFSYSRNQLHDELDKIIDQYIKKAN